MSGMITTAAVAAATVRLDHDRVSNSQLDAHVVWRKLVGSQANSRQKVFRAAAQEEESSRRAHTTACVQQAHTVEWTSLHLDTLCSVCFPTQLTTATLHV